MKTLSKAGKMIWKKMKTELSFAAWSQWRLTWIEKKKTKVSKSSTHFTRFQNNHSHLCLTLKAVLDLLPQGGRPQIRMGPSTAGLQRHKGRREHFSAILVQQALYVTPINVFRQFSALEEHAADKTEPLSGRWVGKHLKRIHWIQTMYLVSCNFISLFLQ